MNKEEIQQEYAIARHQKLTADRSLLVIQKENLEAKIKELEIELSYLAQEKDLQEQ